MLAAVGAVDTDHNGDGVAEVCGEGEEWVNGVTPLSVIPVLFFSLCLCVCVRNMQLISFTSAYRWRGLPFFFF